MKFQQLTALLKQIDAFFAKKQLPPVYLIVHPQREERRRLMEKLGQTICGLTQAFVSFHEQEDWDSIFHKLSSPSFFGEEEVVGWDVGKGLDEAVVERIVRYVKKPAPKFFLIIGAESNKAMGSLAKQELLTLDVSEEKPWDKEKRLQQELFLQAKALGKTIAPAAVAKMIAMSGSDSLFLEQELMKVVCYVGNKPFIAEEDVLTIGSYYAASTNWQVAEALVWGADFSCVEMDTSILLALIAQMRFLLQQARQIVWLLQEKKEPEEIAKVLNLRSTQLSKIIDRLKKRKPQYLDNALELIYHEEIRAKSSSLPARLLFDILVLRLSQERKESIR